LSLHIYYPLLVVFSLYKIRLVFEDRMLIYDRIECRMREGEGEMGRG